MELVTGGAMTETEVVSASELPLQCSEARSDCGERGAKPDHACKRGNALPIDRPPTKEALRLLALHDFSEAPVVLRLRERVCVQ